MQIQAPLRHVKRMRTKCYCKDGTFYNFSTTLSGQCVFEVEDFVTAILYTPIERDGTESVAYLWEGVKWASLESEVAQRRVAELNKPVAKPIVKQPIVNPYGLGISSKLPSTEKVAKKLAKEVRK